LAAFIAVAGYVATASPTPAPNVKPTLPNPFFMTTLGAGTIQYTASAAAGEGITRATGVTVRLIPCTTDPGQLVPLIQGKAQAWWMAASRGYTAATSSGPIFADWPPQRLRKMWYLFSTCSSFAVRGDSKIFTAKDLTGKRIALPAGIEAHLVMAKALLAFLEIPLEQVKIVGISGGATGAFRSLLEGKADAVNMPTDQAAALEMASAPCGIRWIELPADNVAGWERYWKFAPWMSPIKATSGPGIKPGQQAQLASNPIAVMCYDFLDDNTAYAITKAFHEAYPYYKELYPLLEQATLENTLSPIDWFRFVPFHNGAVKYFKDLGKWTPELEARNQKQFKEDEERIKAWEAAKAAGAVKK
jgi:TRAP transporter TAXI family solute receptor